MRSITIFDLETLEFLKILLNKNTVLWIWDANPGSRIRIFSIPDPHIRI